MKIRNKLFGTVLSLTLLASAGGVRASQQDAYNRIAQETAQIRQLDLLHPLDINVESRDELRDMLLREMETDYPAADQAADLRVLVVFGLVEPGTDLGKLQTDVLGEQIAGYYDPETKRMVVVSDSGGDDISASDEVTFAHETVHALQDQHFDLMAMQPDDLNDDESLAITALIEGDASTGEMEYLLANPKLIRGLQAELADFDSSTLDSAPPILARTLIFPYDEGASFVKELHDAGGWEAVDAAFENPPRSTEQILHPEKYVAGEEPVAVTLNDPMEALGPDWEVFDLNAMGELVTDIFLDSHGIDSDIATQAAEGWGGDQYLVVGDAENTALVWKSAWDTEADAREFYAALARHELSRFDTKPSANETTTLRFEGEGVVGEIRRDGDQVLYVLAPDEATLETLLASQEGEGPVMTPAPSEDATPAAASR